MQSSAHPDQTDKKNNAAPPDPFEIKTDQERRILFLRYINRGWLAFGVVTLAALPLFPEQRSVFVYLIAVIFPTYLLASFINRLGKLRLAGLIFSLSVNFSFYGLFILLVHQMGAVEAFNSQISVWMLMGLAVLFAGALVNKWAAPALALINMVLLIGTRLTLAPDSDPRPSALVFWWMMALTIWLYEGMLEQYFLKVSAELANRKHTEEALHLSEEKFARAFQSTPDSIVISSLEDGRLIEVNEGFEKIFGYSREEVIGHSVLELGIYADPTVRQYVMQLLHEHGSIQNMEVTARDKAGAQRIVMLSAEIIEINGKTHMVAINRDITEHKRAEKALRESQMKYRDLVEHLPQVIYTSELGLNGVWKYVSPQIEQLLGYAPQEWQADPTLWYQLVHPQDRDKQLTLEKEAQTHNRFFESEYRMLTRAGDWIWVRDSGRIFPSQSGSKPVVQGVLMDVTERKQAEDALSLSKAQLLANLNDTPNVAIQWYDGEGRILYWNPASEAMYGWKSIDAVGRTLDQLIHTPEEQLEFLRILAEVRETGKPFGPYESPVRKWDGTTGWVLATTFSIPMNNDQTGFVCMDVDITERKQAEEDLRQSENRYRNLFNTIEEGVAINQLVFDENGNVVDYIIQDVNPAFERHSPYKIKEALGKRATELYQMTTEFIHDWWDEHRQKKQAAQTEYYHPPSGRWFFITTTVPEEERFATIFLNITERKRGEEALRESEAKHRTLFETANDSIFLMKEDRIVDCNSRTLAIFGCTREQIIGKTPVDFSPSTQYDGQASQDKATEKLAAVHNGDPQFFEWSHCRQDGSLFDAEVSLNRLELGGEVYVQAIVRDITERKRAEMELTRYAQNTATMYQLSQQILTSLNLDQVYKNTHEAVQKLMPCDSFVIALLDETAQEIEDVYLWDKDKRWPGNRYPIGRDFTNYIISSGKTLLVNQWDETHARITDSTTFGYTEEDTQSVLAVPLLRKNGSCFGMISAQAYAPNSYTPQHEQLLVTLANQVSEAMENIHLFENLAQSNYELATAYDATIEGWSRAMDLRDRETEGHTQRVTSLTMKLAQQMGMAETALIHIRRGGLLHDIGKLGVPDSILLKDADLNREEWEIMRRHPSYAYDMISSIAYLKPALDIPYCHHEKWDGSGYPRGLKGGEIPLAARIFSVVDVWDALTSDRPYRPAWTREKTLEYIGAQSGKQFDPQIVDAFLKLIAIEQQQV